MSSRRFPYDNGPGEVTTADELSADTMPLPEAARLAHRRVFSGTLRLDADALDLIATALSGYVAIYGSRHTEPGLTQVTESEFATGSFRGGATRFEFRDGRPPILDLAVRKADLKHFFEVVSPPRGDPK